MSKLFRWGIVVALAAVLLLIVATRSRQRAALPTGSVAPAVSLGATHGLILSSDGSLWTWGSDFLGWPVLGLGKTTHSTALRRVGPAGEWRSISAGQDHNLAIKADGSLWAWGQNIYWQLGDGSTAGWQRWPVRSAPGNHWKQAAAGGSFSVALKQNGTLWSWGNNWAGQLGNGTTTKSALPVQVGTSTNWARVWAGGVRVAGLQKDGSLWIWGNHPPPPDGSAAGAKTTLQPARISPDTNWIEAGFGPEVFLALKSDGTLWASGSRAPIFTGTTNDAAGFTPARLGTNSDWAAFTSAEEARDLYLLLRKRDGSIWEMTASMVGSGVLRLRPIPLTGDFVALAGGGGGGHGETFMHDGVCTGVALTREGEVWTWGRALGHANAVLQSLAETAQRFRYEAHWGDARAIDRDQPWRLPNTSTP